MFNICWIVKDAELILRDRWDFLLDNSRSMPALVATATQDLLDIYRSTRNAARSLTELNPDCHTCFKRLPPHMINNLARAIRFAIISTARLYYSCHLRSEKDAFDNANKQWTNIANGYIVASSSFERDVLSSSLEGLIIGTFSVHSVDSRGTELKPKTLIIPWANLPSVVSQMSEEIAELEHSYLSYLALADQYYAHVGRVSGPTVKSPTYYIP